MVNKKMLKESAYFYIMTVIATVAGFVSTMIIVRIFSVEEFGIFQTLVALFGMLSAFLIQGLNIFIQKSIIEKRYGFVKYVYPLIFKYMFVFLGIASIMLLYFFPLYEKYITIAALLIFSFSLFDRSDAIAAGLKKFTIARYLLLSRNIMYLIFIIIFYFNKISLEHFIWFYSLFNMFFALVGFHVGKVLLKECEDMIEFDVQSNREKLFAALKNSVFISYGVVAAWIDRMILSIISIEQLAIFHIAQLIPKALKENSKSLFFVPINNWIANGEKYAYMQVWKYKYLIFSLGAILSVIIFFFSKFIIVTFFGQDYVDSAFYMGIFSATLGFQFLLYFIHSIAALGSDIKMFNNVLFIGPTSKIIGSLVLVPAYGLDGVMWSNLFAEMLVYGYSLYFFLKKRESLK